MLACGKNMPKNNQFSVLCTELIKNCPEKVKNYPEKKIYPIHAVQPLTILGLKNAAAMWTPPFGTTVPICDVNIWQRQSNENDDVAVAVWTSSYGSSTLSEYQSEEQNYSLMSSGIEYLNVEGGAGFCVIE